MLVWFAPFYTAGDHAPTLRHLKTKLEQLDDEDLKIEDLPDAFEGDRR